MKKWIIVGSFLLVIGAGVLTVQALSSRYSGSRSVVPSAEVSDDTQATYVSSEVKDIPAAPVIENYCQIHLERCEKACDPAKADAHEDTPHINTAQDMDKCRSLCRVLFNDCRAKTTEADAKAFEQYNR